MEAGNLGERERERECDLYVSDLLRLKFVDGLLQTSGGARGVHGGSLELCLSLPGEREDTMQSEHRDTLKKRGQPAVESGPSGVE